MWFNWFSKAKDKVARVLDSAFRGLSRGLALKTLVEILGRTLGFEPSSSATIAGTSVAIAASITSYTGTRWWTLEAYTEEEVRAFMTSNRSCFFQTMRCADALFRGAGRAEVVMNTLMILGQLTDEDLLMSAGVAGFITLVLATWTSYNRGGGRVRYGEALLPRYAPEALTVPLIYPDSSAEGKRGGFSSVP